MYGGPNKDFLKKHGLNEKSHPMNWLNYILPLTAEDNLEDIAAVDAKGDGKTKFSVANWTKYTNSKAYLAGAGEPGNIYAGNFTPFNDDDIRKFIGVLVLDGLAPSPRLYQK